MIHRDSNHGDLPSEGAESFSKGFETVFGGVEFMETQMLSAIYTCLGIMFRQELNLIESRSWKFFPGEQAYQGI